MMIDGLTALWVRRENIVNDDQEHNTCNIISKKNDSTHFLKYIPFTYWYYNFTFSKYQNQDSHFRVFNCSFPEENHIFVCVRSWPLSGIKWTDGRTTGKPLTFGSSYQAVSCDLVALCGMPMAMTGFTHTIIQNPINPPKTRNTCLKQKMTQLDRQLHSHSHTSGMTLISWN